MRLLQPNEPAGDAGGGSRLAGWLHPPMVVSMLTTGGFCGHGNN